MWVVSESIKLWQSASSRADDYMQSNILLRTSTKSSTGTRSATTSTSTGQGFRLQDSSLLDKQLIPTLIVSLVAYVVLITLTGLDWAYSQTPICGAEHVASVSRWVHDTELAAAAVLVVFCVLQLLKICKLYAARGKKRNTSLIKLNFLLFTLLSISATSSLLAFVVDFGGFCRDAFGVYSNGGQWAEWFVTVPLLQYAALAGEQKERLGTFEWTMLVLLALMILCGFLISIPGVSIPVASVLLAMSSLCLIAVTAMTCRYHTYVQGLCSGVKLRGAELLALKRKKRKAKLLYELVAILWYYPLVYFLALFGALSAEYTLAGFMLGGMLGKVVFASLVVESQINLLYEYLLSTAGYVSLGVSLGRGSGAEGSCTAPSSTKVMSKVVPVAHESQERTTTDDPDSQSFRLRTDGDEPPLIGEANRVVMEEV